MTVNAEQRRDIHDPIVIAGITGTGKTALSLAIAERYRERGQAVEILNGDALQLYRGMDIGTAKLSAEERAQVPHHLFDVLDITETATVADFQGRARSTIRQIQQRGAIPILVGGSGLYLSAVFQDFSFPPQDPALRRRLEDQAETAEGKAEILQILQERDPETAAQIDQSNIRRVIRALEVVLLTGETYRASLPEHAPHWSPATMFFLDGDREDIRQRLRLRTELMFEQGLLNEVRGLLKRGLERGTTAPQAIGYRQAIAVLTGEKTLDEAIEETWMLTVRFARRQRSWFNRYDNIFRLEYSDPELVDHVMQILDHAGASER